MQTGPPKWNALGLGSTALFARALVYNTTRTGVVKLGGRTFELQRTAFPTNPPAEWYVIDLLRNLERVGLDAADVEPRLAVAIEEQRLSGERLVEMAARFGRRVEQDLLLRAIQGRSHR
jgi:hypothetical protein